jgi:ubiquinone/menaquinone biosynthesis C-methylase UbiE
MPGGLDLGVGQMIRCMLRYSAVFHRLNAVLDWLNQPTIRCLRRGLMSGMTGRILDVECGTSRYAGIWRGSYVGLDADEDYLRFAQGLGGHRFVRGDADWLPLRDDGLDAAFCGGSCSTSMTVR